ncbi:hypothetical protein [Caenispirillum bisanense]|uniref:hypothetical protein n=1 Tax=Caenispirillum bisanense TaxID=414052 RepID=UPI0031DE762C
MHRDQTLAARAVARETAACEHRGQDFGCPVEARVDGRLPEVLARGMQDEAVEMALDAAHIGVFCARSCPAVDPLIGIVNRAAAEEAADADGLLRDGDSDGAASPTVRRLNRLPADASEPARHAFLLVRAAYRLRQARTADALWQAVDANLGCWIALRAAIADGRIRLSSLRRRQLLQYADYVEHMTAATRPMADSLVEAFIRLDRTVAAWLTEDATDRVVGAGDGRQLAAAE